MARLSIRIIALAAWCVMAAATLGVSDMAWDDPPQALLAVGHAPARHHAIRRPSTGSRLLPSFQSGLVITARPNQSASTMRARRAHVTVRPFLLNLIAPRAPASPVL